MKKLSPVQLENMKQVIHELTVHKEVEEFFIEVQEFFERHPTHDCIEIVPRTMGSLLRKFVRIMEGSR